MRSRILPRLACLSLALAGAAAASDPSDLAAWRAEHGSGWRATLDPETGHVALLWGSSLPAPAMRPVLDEHYVVLAEQVALESAPLHGLSLATLVPGDVEFLPLPGTTDKLSVELRQVVGGVPVEGGTLNVLFDLEGRVLSVDSTGLPGAASLTTRPVLTAAQARARAEGWFRSETGVPADTVDPPELVVRQVRSGSRRHGVLAWRVSTLGDPREGVPVGWAYYVDARTGALADRRSTVHHDVHAHVDSNASPGDEPDTAGNPPTPHPMKHMEVTSSAGTVVTDENGDFVLPGASAPVDVTVRYLGPFAEVVNAAGGNHILTQTLLADSGETVLMNPGSVPTVTAEANAFRWINELRDWIRSVDPTDGTADFQALANVNLPGPCNAFWTSAGGGSVNFFVENLCVNTSYSTVVVHEMGHWLNARYGSGNGSDGFGEGNADVFAMYLLDTPIVGRGFSGPGTFVRTGKNTRQFCGDCCGGCHGGVHDDGEVLMGALWKVRRNLKQTHGKNVGGAIADGLFIGWMNAYNDGQIKTIIETHWLVLDDDDGDISNGTPHYADIDSGFREQGFPGVDVDEGLGTSYCSANANSTGSAAEISATGSDVVADNDVTLHGKQLPNDEFGYFLMSATKGFVADFGGSQGNLCLGAPQIRLTDTIQSSGGQGEISSLIDLTDLPQDTVVQPGETWYFQLWYRDVNPDHTSNTTDGLEVAFQ